ncbi:MAG: type II toxin-antitoxin system VapC family toxin [Xanthobacteraceae bacterium]
MLDTHAALWFTTDDPHLGPVSRSLLVEASADGRLAISAISFWEISLLITKGRLRTSETPTEIRGAMFEAGIAELPLTGDICLLAVALPGLHSDPADRFITATAVTYDATLMTVDAALLRWPHAIQRHNASR